MSLISSGVVGRASYPIVRSTQTPQSLLHRATHTHWAGSHPGRSGLHISTAYLEDLEPNLAPSRNSPRSAAR